MVALPCALDCSSGIWTQTADQPMPCTCARKKIGAAADRIEACHQKFMLRRRRKTSQRFSRCSASREPLLSDPNAHGSHPRREAATSCGLSICRRLLYLVWLTLCERLTLVCCEVGSYWESAVARDEISQNNVIINDVERIRMVFYE